MEKKIDKLMTKPPKGTRDLLPDQMAIREEAQCTIRKIFMQHGAVQIDTPVFERKEVLQGKYGE
jgi:histidyl-tRNA synthetase